MTSNSTPSDPCVTSETVPGGWRPMTTAPKDGTPYLAADRRGRYAVLNEPPNCVRGNWQLTDGFWSGGYVEFSPAYWMPIRPVAAPSTGAPTLSDLNELAKVYASSYASPHHITFTIEGLRNFFATIKAESAADVSGVQACGVDGWCMKPECRKCHPKASPDPVQNARDELAEMGRFGNADDVQEATVHLAAVEHAHGVPGTGGDHA